mgnify:FL=1|tara:strand:- start:268 stop:456 length:189 start_codon:yes stop_codon:yes gene_type:complete
MAIIQKEVEERDYGNCAKCNVKLTQMGALLWDNSGTVCNDCDWKEMIIPNIKSHYGGKKCKN